MPVTVKEVRRSRGVTSEGVTREYIAYGSNDADAVETAVGLVAPATIGSLVSNSYDQQPHEDDDSVWNIRIGYGKAEAPPEPTATGGNDLSLELSMVTSHVTRSLSTIHSYGTDPPPMEGIGFNGEKYEGTDIQVPLLTFRLTDYRAIEDITNTYIDQLHQCAANPINSAIFRGFPIGTLMYMGCSGSQRSSADFAITHSFLVSINRTGITIGDITGIDKKGHEYLWVLYEKDEDTDSKSVIEVPRAVYVEQMYGSSNYTTLLEIT